MKHRLFTIFSLSAGILFGLLVIPASASDSPRDSTTTTTTTTTTMTTSTTSSTTTTTTSVPTTTTTEPQSVNPFMVHAVVAYLKNRTNLVTAAVYDVRSGRTYLYNPNVHETTASMVKIDFLADLLYEAQEGRELTVKEDLLATTMIEFSNNRATNQLWTDIGGRDAIDSFNTLIGFKQTFPSYSWGDIETSPRDQLQLLKVIILPNAILSAASRAYESFLMEDVTPGQRFGLGWGSPAQVTVGLKDGWYLDKSTGWQINSSGFVQYNGRLYLATIMCTNNPDEAYGEGTVTTLSRLIWQNLKP